MQEVDFRQILSFKNKHCVISALEWGLGHVSRTIPIIRFLMKSNKLSVLCSAKVKNVYLEEFPGIEIIDFPDYYNVSYSGSGSKTVLKLALKSFGIIKAIKAENKALNDLVNRNKIDVIISDNRYGLYSDSVKSYFVTHQLNVQIPALFKGFSGMVNKTLQKYINRFDCCLIPDYAGDKSLAGRLSDNLLLDPGKVFYIGALSRFSCEKASNLNYSIDVLFVISGPEPTRTFLEKMFLRVSEKYKTLKIFVFRGKPGEVDELITSGNVVVYNHLSSSKFENIFKNARLIVSRAGYSSIMDYHVCNKTAIMIPTPGQTEQEYLAEYLKKRKDFFFIKDDLNCEANLQGMVESLL